MNIKNLKIYDNLDEETLRKLYLRKIALGEIQGPMTGYASQDMPWLKYYDEKNIMHNMPSGSIYDYLKNSNENHLGRVALNYFNRKITYGDLLDNIEKTAKALKANGVNKGDIVTISMPTLPETVYLFYAISKIGAIANMVDPRTSKEGIANYVNEVNSKLFVVVDVAYPKVKDFVDITSTEKILVVSPADSLPVGLNIALRAKNYIEALKDANKKVEYSDTCINWKNFIDSGKLYNDSIPSVYESNKPVVIVHTGGTTGTPKGVMLSNENLNAAACQCQISGIDMQREHTWLNIMPPFIAYGVGNGLHLPLVIGMETFLIPSFDPNKFDELLIKHRPNHMVGVPSHYGNIINSKKLAKEDLSYVIAPTVGGDTMDINLEKETNKFFEEHNCDYYVTKGYGMTEVSAAVSVCISNECNKLGSVGIPFTHTTISIFDPETGEELGYNQDGEVCMKGPNTMLGYFENPEATDMVLRKHNDGKYWIHSGDIGYMTEDGFLYIKDRIKRMIVRHDGFKVFPSQIEKEIISNDFVEKVVVVKTPDLEHSQGCLPAAYVVLKDKNVENENTYLEMIRKYCEKKLPEYCQPVKYISRDDLPLTSIGKIDFTSLENEEMKNKVKKITK